MSRGFAQKENHRIATRNHGDMQLAVMDNKSRTIENSHREKEIDLVQFRGSGILISKPI